jgi:hypothetical protein
MYEIPSSLDHTHEAQPLGQLSTIKDFLQCMGEPTLGYSPIQLKLANQHRVLPIGRLKGVTIDLDGMHTKEDFKVI